MERNTGWKRIVYLMCAIQVGAGIAMIGVMAFLPLFLGEIGVTAVSYTHLTLPTIA